MGAARAYRRGGRSVRWVESCGAILSLPRSAPTPVSPSGTHYLTMEPRTGCLVSVRSKLVLTLYCSVNPRWSTYMLSSVSKVFRLVGVSPHSFAATFTTASLCGFVAFLGVSGCSVPVDDTEGETSAMEGAGEVSLESADWGGCSSWVYKGCCTSTKVKELRSCSGVSCDSTGCWEDTWTETRCRSVLPFTCY